MINNKGKFLLLCIIIGGGVGGYLSYINKNYLYSAIGPIIGLYLGLYLNKYVRIADLGKVRSKKLDLFFICTGMIMSSLGIVAFIYTKKLEMVLASIFFFAGSIYLILHIVSDTDKSGPAD